MTGQKRCRGVTLVEVLVAVVILGIGLTAAMRTGTASTRTLEGARTRTFAHWAAVNRAEELRIQGDAAGQGPTEARLGGQRFRVTETREPGPFGLIRVEIRAAGPDGPGARFVTWISSGS
jgi:general secretion pathway protein I